MEEVVSGQSSLEHINFITQCFCKGPGFAIVEVGGGADGEVFLGL